MLDAILNVDLLKAVVPLVSGLVVGWLTYLVNNRKTSVDSEIKYREQLLEQIKTLSARLDVVEKKYLEQMEELVELKAKNARLETLIESNFNHLHAFESYVEHMPNPAWLKDPQGNMIFINEAYERQWGISRLKYEGNPDDHIWPKEQATIFRHNDELVILHLKGISFIESVPADPYDPQSSLEDWLIWKFPVMYHDDLIGIGGVALRKETMK